MTDQPQPGPPPNWTPAPEQPRTTGLPKWFAPVMAGAALVVVALLAVVIVLLTRGDSTDDTASDKTPSGAPSSAGSNDTAASDGFEVYGHLRLTDSNILRLPGGFCAGQDGYDDVASDAQVVIRNSTNQTIAVGSLGVGTKPDGEAYASQQCDFYFRIEDVPVQDDDIYSVEVGSRGDIAFIQSQAESLELSLGN